MEKESGSDESTDPAKNADDTSPDDSEEGADETSASQSESSRQSGRRAAAMAVLLAVSMAVIVGIGNCLFVFEDERDSPTEVTVDVDDDEPVERVEEVDVVEEAEERTEVDPVPSEEAPEETRRLSDDPFDDFREAFREHYEEQSEPLIHVTVDRPMYRPGQTIRWQSWHLSGGGLEPSPHDEVEIALVDPGDAVVDEVDKDDVTGMATGSFELDEEAAGGEYTFRVTGDDAEFERPVLVSQFEPPRFLKEVDFDQENYRQGDEVEVEVEVRRDTGEPMAGAEIEGYVQIAGNHIADVAESLDAAGRTDVAFELPASIESDDASLVVSIEEGGLVETDVFPVPLALEDVEVVFKPEGGEMVESLTSRVYFEATDRSGDPVEVEGHIVDGDGTQVADVTTEYRGRGRFELTPRPGEDYSLELTKPEAMKTHFDLPSAESDGCVLRHYDDFDSQQDSVRVGVWCSDNRTVGILGAMGDELYDTARMVAGPDRPAVAHLRPEDGQWPRPAGTVRTTVAEDDEDISILAERVGFRGRRAQMRVDLRFDQEVYHPGQTVEMKVWTTTRDGEPMSADLALGAVDDRVHAEAAHLDTPSILGQVLLMADDLHFWGDVEEADEYFDLYEDSAEGLDLLTGVRGWRSDDEREHYYVDAGEVKIPEPPPEPQIIGRPAPEPAPRALQAFEAADQMGVVEDSGGVGTDVLSAGDAVEADSAAGGSGIGLDDGGGADRERSPSEGRSGPSAPQAPAEPEPEPEPEADADEDAGPTAPRFMRDDDAVAFAAWDAQMRSGTDGALTYEFELPEAVGAYRVVVEGVSDQGFVGAGEGVVPVEVPLGATVRLPEILSGGDRVDLPVTVRNATEMPIDADVEVDVDGPAEVVGEDAFSVEVPPTSTMTRYVPMDVEDSRKEVTVEVWTQGGGFTDGASREASIMPRGFKRDWTTSGELPGTAHHEIPLMGMTDAGAEAELAIYPSPVAEALEGVDSMARRPMGCFEQTSSRNHPNLLVWDYLKHTGELDGDIESTLRNHTRRAYERMTNFEIGSGGFEWFGRGSAGQAYLTAWALVQFSMMEPMLDGFDRGLVNRSVSFLQGLADDQGGWSGGSDRHWRRVSGDRRRAAELFVTYGLARSGHTSGFEAQLEESKEVATSSDNVYEVALATATLAEAGHGQDVLREAVDHLSSFQGDDGAFRPDGGRSWAGGYGGAFDVETTGMAAIALIEAGGSQRAVARAIDWLDAQKSGRSWWGSTQATVMALEARVTYEREGIGDKEGSVTVSVDGEQIASAHVSTDDQQPKTIDGIGPALSEESREVRIHSQVPLDYDLTAEWRLEDFETDDEGPLEFEVSIPELEDASMGDEISLEFVVVNNEDDGLGMVVARLAIPAGVEVADRELSALVDRTDIDYYETTGREVILYFDEFGAEEAHTIRLSATADVPGTYEVPASVAYAYYRDESEWQWSDRSELTVDTPRP